MRYCIFCGGQLTDDAKFCIHCGKPINPNIYKGEQKQTQINSSTQTQPKIDMAKDETKYYSENQEEEYDNENRSHKWFIWILVIAIIAAIGAGAYFYLQKNNPAYDKSETNSTASVETYNMKSYIMVNDFPGEALSLSKGYLTDELGGGHYDVQDNGSTYHVHELDGEDTEVPKNLIEIKTLKIANLPIDKVGDKADFVADDGSKISIIKAHLGRHSVKDYHMSDDSYSLNDSLTEVYRECYAFVQEEDLGGGKVAFATPLVEENGMLMLFEHQSDGTFISEVSENIVFKEGNPVDSEGNILSDIENNNWEGDLFFFSAAYLPEEDAMYYQGKIYKRNK